MSKTISAKTIAAINAIVILLAGVLFLFLDLIGSKWINVILGISVILLGLITLITDLLKSKTLISRSVVIGSAIVALGILIISKKVASTALGIIPFVFIMIGACVFADAFLLRFWRNNKNVLLFVLELLAGAFLITLGILFLTVASFTRYMSITFGVILIAYAIYLLINVLSSTREKQKKSSK